MNYIKNNHTKEVEPSTFGDPIVKTLYLVEQGTILGKEDKRLKVVKHGQVINTIPITKIDQIFVFGNIQITNQAMRLCLDNELPIILFSTYGRYHGAIESSNSVKVHMQKRQFELSQNKEFSLSVAKSIVRGKIKNSKVVLQKYNRRNERLMDENIAFINSMLTKIDSAEDISHLMGIEGATSARYFASMRLLLPDEWQFKKRKKYPSTDPVNSMLNYGYSILFHNIYGLVRSEGLHPYVGFLHGLKDGHPTLVSDLIEEFRAPIVDSTVLNLLSRKILSPDNFEYTEGDTPVCVLSGNAMKIFIKALENKMNSSVIHGGTGTQSNYRRCMQLQVKQIKELIDGTRHDYEPMAIK